MATSTLITDYVARGLHSARPASPNIPTGATTLYYETDTGNAFVWDGSAWQAVGSGGGGGGPPTTSYWNFYDAFPAFTVIANDYLGISHIADTSHGVYGGIRATGSKSSGKAYWELKILNNASSAMSFGLTTAADPLNAYIGFSAGWAIAMDGSAIVGSSGSPTNGSAYSNGDVIGFAVDFSGGRLDFYKNNSANGFITGATFGTAFIAVASNNPMLMKLRTTSADCTYSPPSTYSNWD